VLAQSAVGIRAGIPAAAEMVCKGMTPRDPNYRNMTVRLAAIRFAACVTALTAPADPSSHFKVCIVLLCNEPSVDCTCTAPVHMSAISPESCL
jgi:hypothetical protein